MIEWTRRLLSPESPAGPGGNGNGVEIDRHVAAQYFSGAYVGMLAHHEQWRLLIAGMRAIAAVTGLALLALTAYDVFRHMGTLLIWSLPTSIARTPLWLGAILLVTAVPKALWNKGWEPAAAAMAAAAGLQLAFFNSGDRRVMLALVALALLIIAVGVWLRVQRRKLPVGLAELEPHLDAWTDNLLQRTIRDPHLPVSLEEHGASNMILRAIPRSEALKPGSMVCRIGTDNRPRMTPAAIAAFGFKAETLVLIEAAVDLASEALLYRTAHEIRYGDIVSLGWSTEEMPAPEVARPSSGSKSPLLPARAAPRNEPPRRRDSLDLHLSDGRSLHLVFNDTALLPHARRDTADIPGIERPEKIRELWQRLIATGARAAASNPDGS